MKRDENMEFDRNRTPKYAKRNLNLSGQLLNVNTANELKFGVSHE